MSLFFVFRYFDFPCYVFFYFVPWYLVFRISYFGIRVVCHLLFRCIAISLLPIRSDPPPPFIPATRAESNLKELLLRRGLLRHAQTERPEVNFHYLRGRKLVVLRGRKGLVELSADVLQATLYGGGRGGSLDGNRVRERMKRHRINWDKMGSYYKREYEKEEENKA